MIELFVIGLVALCAFVVIGTLVAAASLLGWLLWLPFKILHFALRGVGLLLALPFILLFALLAAVALGIGALVLFTPLVPIAAIVLLFVWLMRRSRHPAIS